MTNEGPGGTLEASEDLAARGPADDERRHVLRLYVAGMTARSTEALATIKRVCEEFLKDQYDLEVVDIYQHPHSAAAEQIVAVPLLVRTLPSPPRRLIGDLSDRERVLRGLDLPIPY